MTEQLKPDLASDIHPGLIALYEKCRTHPNWLDGFECTEELYHAAKELPDDDALKAFIGFGCSFGGNWFRAYGKPHPKVSGGRLQSLVGAERLKRVLQAIPSVEFACMSFFDLPPTNGVLLYLDPPYRGTALAGAHVFDFGAFDARVCEWAEAGSICYVSEYEFPRGSLVWERKSHGTAGAGIGGGKEITERLFRVAA